MKKFLKYLFITIFTLIILLVGAVFLIDPNDFKQEITAQAEKHLGRDFAIHGDISRTFWPNIGLSIQGVELGNPKGFDDTPFAKVQELSVGVELLPLLSKDIRVKTVTLAGVSLNLEKDADGRANWEGFGKAKAQTTTAEKEPMEQATDDKPTAPPTLSLDGLTLNDVNLTYQDQQTGQRIAINDLSATIGAIDLANPGAPFEITLSLGVKNDKPAAEAKISFSGVVSADLEQQQYKIDGLKLAVDAKGKAVGPTPISTALAGDIAVDMAQQVANINNLTFALAGMQLSGDVQAEHFLSSPKIKANLKTNTFNLKQLLQQLGQAPIETKLASALTQIAAQFNITASINDVSIQQLKIRLDDTTLTGDAQVASFSNPAIKFNLAVDDINVDNYLPPPVEKDAAGSAAKPAKTGGAKSTPADLPLAPLKALNLNGKLTIQKVIVSNLKLDGISVQIKAKNGVVEISEQIKALYQGSQSADIKIDVRKKTARFKVVEKLVNVEMGPLLADLGNPDMIEGVSNFAVDLTAHGNNPEVITKNLNGTVGFAFNDGALKWLDMIGSLGLNKEISGLVLKEMDFDTSAATGKTEFSELKGNGRLKNGIMTLNDLSLTSPRLSAKGKGTINLPEQTLDYKLALQQVKVRKNAQGIKEFEPKGRAINLSLTGPLSDPKKSVDVLAMLKSKETEKIQKKIDEKLEQLGIPENITKDLKKFLPF